MGETFLYDGLESALHVDFALASALLAVVSFSMLGLLEFTTQRSQTTQLIADDVRLEL